MKFSEASFRDLYHRLVLVDLSSRDKGALEGFPRLKEANCAAAYVYYDSHAGMSLEILEIGKRTAEGYESFGGNPEIGVRFRLSAVENKEVIYPDDEEYVLR